MNSSMGQPRLKPEKKKKKKRVGGGAAKKLSIINIDYQVTTCEFSE
jgi:hypothetical protein